MLRENIQKIVEHSRSSEEAALLTILYLEDEAGLSLEGNGWLDDDPKWQELSVSQSDDENLLRLQQRLHEILS